jgi:hypothetical protein
MLQIALGIYGIVILCTGRIKLSADKVVEGTAARLLALILIAPFPLAFVVGMVVGVMAAAEGKNLDEIQGSLMLVDVALTIGAAALTFGIAHLIARSPHEQTVEALPEWAGFQTQRSADTNNPYQSPRF